MPRSNRKSELLDAAAQLIEGRGVEVLTLDAVAIATGTSKGGVLYHFPTKQALVQALVERLLQRFETRIAPGKGDFIERFTTACIVKDPDGDKMTAGLAVAIAADPSLLEPLRAQYALWTRQLCTSAADPVDGWLIRLALDGLWFADLLGLPRPTKAQRQHLAKRLIELGRGPV